MACARSPNAMINGKGSFVNNYIPIQVKNKTRTLFLLLLYQSSLEFNYLAFIMKSQISYPLYVSVVESEFSNMLQYWLIMTYIVLWNLPNLGGLGACSCRKFSQCSKINSSWCILSQTYGILIDFSDFIMNLKVFYIAGSSNLSWTKVLCGSSKILADVEYLKAFSLSMRVMDRFNYAWWLGHYLLNSSFSSGTFPELCVGGRHITIMPLFNYIGAFQEMCFANTSGPNKSAVELQPRCRQASLDETSRFVVIESLKSYVWRIHHVYLPWY